MLMQSPSKAVSSSSALSVTQAQAQLLALRDKHYDPKNLKVSNSEVPKEIANVLVPRTVSPGGKLYLASRHSLILVPDNDPMMIGKVTIMIADLIPENPAVARQLKKLSLPKLTPRNVKLKDPNVEPNLVGKFFQVLGRPFEILSSIRDYLSYKAGF